MNCAVKRTCTIRHLLAALAWLGLLLAPLASPTAAMAASTEMTAEHQASMDMPDGMPCCPETQKKPGCADCPLMALCAGPLVASVPSSLAVAVPVAYLAALVAPDDAERGGLVHGPPAKPPKA